MDIYDKKKCRWYRVERNFLGRLVLKELIYQGLTRFPTDSDLTIGDC